MNKLILLVVAAAAYGGARHMDWVSPNVQLQGASGSAQVLVADADAKATFTVTGPAEQTYMLFGGSVNGDVDGHAWLAGLELGDAKRIARRHPDFHLCKSPGAAEAQGLLKDVQMVADRRTVAKLKSAFKDHEQRLGKDAERLCATLRGQWLELDRLEMGGQVMTAEQFRTELRGRATRRVNLHVQSVHAHDCRDSM